MGMVIARRSILAFKLRSTSLHLPSLKCFCRELSFQDAGINIKLTRMLRNRGIRDPTDIQEKAIRNILAGKNIVINSETGSGKTLAYALPMLNRIHEIKRKGLSLPSPYGMVLVPSVELQYQVSNVFGELGANVCCATEDSPLRLRNTDIIVSNAIYLMTYPLDIFRQVQTIVFDEADIMIAKKIGKHGRKDPLFNLIHQFLESSHFQSFNLHEDENVDNSNESLLDGTQKYDVDDGSINDNINGGNQLLSLNKEEEDSNTRIFNDNRQFVFVGATMPDSEARRSKVAMNYIRNWVPNIETIQSENVHKLLANIEMVYSHVQEGNKLKLLIQTLREYDDARVLVFVNRYDNAVSLHKLLTKFHYRQPVADDDTNFLSDLYKFHVNWEGCVHAVHRDVKVGERMEIFNEFSSSSRSLIITTDVACRGLDLPDVDIVVQYDFATNIIDVLHRAGRTGRMGKQGKVLNFITEGDEGLSGMLKEATASGESLDTLFSRRRGLQRKLKRAEHREGNAEHIVEEEDGAECDNESSASRLH